MAFQPAALSAIEGLAAPRAAATNAIGGGDSSGLFQLLVAGAAAPTGETPIAGVATAPIAPIAPANAGGAFALLLQTGEAPTPSPVSEQTTPFAQAAFTPAIAAQTQAAAAPTDAADIIQQPATQTAIAPEKPQGSAATPAIPGANAAATETSIVATATPQPAGPVDASALVLLAAVLPDDQPATPPQQPVATNPDAAQAIVFAPFVAAAPAQPAAKTVVSKTSSDAISADQPDAAPNDDVFKKFVFNAPSAKDNAGGAGNANASIVRVAADAQTSLQAMQPQRPDSSQPGAASPIAGFEAPRAAADALSTPVARAPHGAAAMQIAQHISRNFQGSSSNFQVRLDPAELGRVDVKISVDHEKRVTASVSADNPQTLTDLRGAARDIERALNEAGLDLAQDGLSFEMNQRQASDDEFDASPYAAGKEDAAGAETIAIAAKPFGMERWSNSGVDVWA